MSLAVKCFSRGIQAENTYVITDSDTGYKAVIDPGYYGEDVRAEISDAGSLKYILLTHGHYDHFAAAEDYIENYPDAIFAVPAGESHLLNGGRDNKWMALGHGTGVCPEADMQLREGDEVDLGVTVLKVIETPGHTEGGISFYTDKEVFTGDTLFRLTVGNMRLETGNKNDLICSIRNKLYALDGDTVVYPGHGAVSTIGFEKDNNPIVRGGFVLRIPDGTAFISNGAYAGRRDFTEVLIPDSVTEIGAGAFTDCSSLEKAELPKGLVRIKKELFSGCTGLKEVTIPEGVQSIGEWAFRYCSSLTGIIIPVSVTDIAAEAFLGCRGLTISAEKGSYAESFSDKADVQFKAL